MYFRYYGKQGTWDTHTPKKTSSGDLDGYYYIYYAAQECGDTSHYGTGDGRGSTNACCLTMDDCDSNHVCNYQNKCIIGERLGKSRQGHYGSGDGEGSDGDCCQSNEDCDQKNVCNYQNKCIIGDRLGGGGNGNHAGTGDGQER
ncbi:hypothetical protein G6F27_013982 [Rhizopus arrhizus]|nr:hypothetical protein G6F27_013982 [Rhizopus arrhizus]